MKGLTQSLFEMQRARCHLAVVKNDGGDILGMVTLKDLIEPIVGELEAW